MEYIIIWVGLTFITICVAKSKSRSGFAWFFISLLISPLLALLLVVCLRDLYCGPSIVIINGRSTVLTSAHHKRAL